MDADARQQQLKPLDCPNGDGCEGSIYARHEERRWVMADGSEGDELHEAVFTGWACTACRLTWMDPRVGFPELFGLPDPLDALERRLNRAGLTIGPPDIPYGVREHGFPSKPEDAYRALSESDPRVPQGRFVPCPKCSGRFWPGNVCPVCMDHGAVPREGTLKPDDDVRYCDLGFAHGTEEREGRLKSTEDVLDTLRDVDPERHAEITSVDMSTTDPQKPGVPISQHDDKPQVVEPVSNDKPQVVEREDGSVPEIRCGSHARCIHGEDHDGPCEYRGLGSKRIDLTNIEVVIDEHDEPTGTPIDGTTWTGTWKSSREEALQDNATEGNA